MMLELYFLFDNYYRDARSLKAYSQLKSKILFIISNNLDKSQEKIISTTKNSNIIHKRK